MRRLLLACSVGIVVALGACGDATDKAPLEATVRFFAENRPADPEALDSEMREQARKACAEGFDTVVVTARHPAGTNYRGSYPAGDLATSTYICEKLAES